MASEVKKVKKVFGLPFGKMNLSRKWGNGGLALLRSLGFGSFHCGIIAREMFPSPCNHR